MVATAHVAISATPDFHAAAEAVAHDLGLPFTTTIEGASGLVLVLDERGWSLVHRAPGAPGAVRADFLEGQLAERIRDAHRGESRLARALGLRRHPAPFVLDATAGLGRESVLAAALGCTVIACERSPVVALLLRDALDRAAAGGLEEITGRIDLRVADAREVLAGLPEPPDAILVDPMFPERGKAAKARKEMQLLQRLLGPDEANRDASEAERLLDAALRHARHRVVVKRPAHAPPVGGRRPDHEVPGRAARYDVYLTAGGAG